MTVTRRPAGEARERQRAALSAQSQAVGAGVVRKNVGAAPVFDAGAKTLKAAKTASGAAPKGMISNPWVKHWSGAAPPPSAPARAAAPPAKPHKKAAGAHHASGGESHRRGKGPSHRPA